MVYTHSGVDDEKKPEYLEQMQTQSNGSYLNPVTKYNNVFTAQPDNLQGSASANTAPAFQPSQSLSNAQASLNQLQANQPGEYSSSYTSQINSMLDKILNRTPFSYDMNADPIYQQYKDQYVRQGQTAARDVTGQMAALSGGYGNSYAATAGNQAYQASLAQLNNIIPQLYGQAASNYYQQGQQMLGNLSALQSQDSNAYNQHQGLTNNYFNSLNAAQNAVNSAFSQENTAYQNAAAQYQFDQSQAFQQAQANQAQANWLAQTEAANTKVTKYGYTKGQMMVARAMASMSTTEARNYVNALKISTKAKKTLLSQLGL